MNSITQANGNGQVSEHVEGARPEVVAALAKQAKASKPKSEPKKDVPVVKSGRELLLAAMKSYEATGMEPILSMKSDGFIKTKFPSKVKPPKGWEDGLNGKTVGEVTCALAVETAGMAIQTRGQGSVITAESETRVAVKVSADGDNVLPANAVTAMLGRFLKECSFR